MFKVILTVFGVYVVAVLIFLLSGFSLVFDAKTRGWWITVLFLGPLIAFVSEWMGERFFSKKVSDGISSSAFSLRRIVYGVLVLLLTAVPLNILLMWLLGRV